MTEKFKMRQRLVKDLVDAWYFSYSRLVDFAKENGDDYEAKAWEYLRDHRKFPSKRNIRHNSRYWKRSKTKWNWNFSKLAERKGSSTLPIELKEGNFCNNSHKETEMQALLHAMNGLKDWFICQDNLAKRLEEDLQDSNKQKE